MYLTRNNKWNIFQCECDPAQKRYLLGRRFDKTISWPPEGHSGHPVAARGIVARVPSETVPTDTFPQGVIYTRIFYHEKYDNVDALP